MTVTPKTSSHPATIHDVAERSGVSYQTVSRVINNHPNVAVKTRNRVMQAIQEMNYQPSLLAKSLVTRKSNLIGVIACGTGQYGPTQTINHLQERARTFGYEIMLTTLQDFTLEEIAAASRRLGQFGVDGLILLTPFNASDMALSLPQNVPVVLVDATADVNCSTVSIDQREGGALATRYLWELGHRQILHIGGPTDWSDATLRYQGYLEALRAYQTEPLPRYIGDWSAASGFTAIQRALGDRVPFSAVFAANDQMALGALSALAQAGLRVPEDVSVMGFDDTPEAAYFSPPLTTVRQNFTAIGRKSLEELIRLMSPGTPRERHFVFAAELIERRSTGQASTTGK